MAVFNNWAIEIFFYLTCNSNPQGVECMDPFKKKKRPTTGTTTMLVDRFSLSYDRLGDSHQRIIGIQVMKFYCQLMM
jgi:hypothetical protein